LKTDHFVRLKWERPWIDKALDLVRQEFEDYTGITHDASAPARATQETEETNEVKSFVESFTPFNLHCQCSDIVLESQRSPGWFQA
jgi:hypothetical protein